MDDFQFSRPVDRVQKLVDPGHRGLVEFRVAALGTFKDRESLQDDDGGVSELERQIRNAGLQESSAGPASHVFLLRVLCASVVNFLPTCRPDTLR